MSATNIIEISEKSDDILYPTNDLEDVNNVYNTSDPVVATLSKVICRELQEKRDRQKQNKVASAYTMIFTCMLCVAMSIVIITKLLEDGDRAKLYETLSEGSLLPKVYENEKKPTLLVKSRVPKFRSQNIFTTPANYVPNLNNSVTEISTNNETTTQTSELNLNATTQDTTNDIPTVEPLIKVASTKSVRNCSFRLPRDVSVSDNYQIIVLTKSINTSI